MATQEKRKKKEMKQRSYVFSCKKGNHLIPQLSNTAGSERQQGVVHNFAKLRGTGLEYLAFWENKERRNSPAQPFLRNSITP